MNSSISNEQNVSRNDNRFVQVESIGALRRLIFDVILEEDFSLLERFVKSTSYRKLALIVCASVIRRISPYSLARPEGSSSFSYKTSINTNRKGKNEYDRRSPVNIELDFSGSIEESKSFENGRSKDNRFEHSRSASGNEIPKHFSKEFENSKHIYCTPEESKAFIKNLNIILDLLKCDQDELFLVYLLTKNYLLLSDMLMKDNERRTIEGKIKTHGHIDLFEYIVENEALNGDVNMTTKYMNKMTFDENIHSLLVYKNHIKCLVYDSKQQFKHAYTYLKIHKYLELLEDKLENTKQSRKPIVEVVKKVLNMLNIDYIDNILFYELQEMCNYEIPNNFLTFCSYLFSILCRKYNILSKELLELVNSSDISIKTMFFNAHIEAYKYNNTAFISTLECLNKPTQNSDKFTQSPGFAPQLIQSKELELYKCPDIHSTRITTLYQFNCYNELINWSTYSYYEKELRKLFVNMNMLEGKRKQFDIEDLNKNLLVYHIVYKLCRENGIEDDLEQRCSDQFIYYAKNPTAIPILSEDNYEDIRKDQNKLNQLYRSKFLFHALSKSVLRQYDMSFQIAFKHINYIVKNSLFILLDDLKDIKINWILVEPRSMKKCKDKAQLYKIAGDDAKILKTTLNMNKGIKFDIVM